MLDRFGPLFDLRLIFLRRGDFIARCARAEPRLTFLARLFDLDLARRARAEPRLGDFITRFWLLFLRLADLFFGKKAGFLGVNVVSLP